MKYLLLTALLLHVSLAEVSETKYGVACEGGSITLECPNGEVISIIKGEYGRVNGVTCPHDVIVNLGCASDSSQFIVSNSCNDKPKCTIYAANDVFADPCHGSHKYLEVQYKCIESSIQTATSCYPKPITLSCPTGKVLSIVKANFGRTDDVTCSSQAWSNKNCYAAGTTEIFRKKCNKLKSCKVSPTLFGDPCSGVYKYLDVQYKCVSAYRCDGSIYTCSDIKCVNQYCHNYVCDYGSGPRCPNVQ